MSSLKQIGELICYRKYPLKDEEFEYLVEFMGEQTDTIKVMVNSPFVKALIEEITILRREKRLRLKLVETNNGDDTKRETRES